MAANVKPIQAVCHHDPPGIFQQLTGMEISPLRISVNRSPGMSTTQYGRGYRYNFVTFMPHHADVARKLLILLFLCWSMPDASGQLDQYHPEIINEVSGLSSRVTICFLQDHRGYLWIGTADGLNRYDGYSFRVYKNVPGDTASIIGNFISALAEDQDQCIWAGQSLGGLSCFNPRTGKFTNYTNQANDPSSIPPSAVTALMIDRHNDLWVATGSYALSKFNRKTGTFSHYPQLPDIDPAYPESSRKRYNSIYGIHEAADGLFWLFTHNGLYTFDPATGTFKSVREKPVVPFQWRDDLFTSFVPDHDQGFWMGSWGGGLTYFNKKTKQWKNFKYSMSYPASGTHNIVTGLQWKSKNELWLTTSDKAYGIFHTERGEFEFLSADRLNEVSAPKRYGRIFADRSGNTWFSHEKGISLLRSNANVFKLIPFPVSHSDNGSFYGVPKILYDSIHQLTFVATTLADGLYVINEKTGERKNFKFGIAKNEELLLIVSDIIQDHKGNVWIATRDFLYTFDFKNFRLVEIPQPPKDTSLVVSSYFYKMAEDSMGQIWIITLRSGIFKLDPQTFKYTSYTKHEGGEGGPVSNRINGIAMDKSGHWWFGLGSEGICIYLPEKNKFISFRHDKNDPQSLVNDLVQDMASDPDGNIWVATLSGISKVTGYGGERLQAKNYTPDQGLVSEYITEIESDYSGRIWFSSAVGLGVLSPAENKIKYFSTRHGLTDDYSNFTIHMMPDGNMYVHTFGGYIRFIPEHMLLPEAIPDVAINAFKIFDRENIVDFSQTINLSYSDNFFSFDFASINFSDPEKIKYAYQLAGFDKDWIYCDNRRYASYTNLNGGDYLFRVKAANSDLIWGAPVSVKIHIDGPYWKKPWFVISTVLFFTLIIYLIYRLRIRSIRKTEALKTAFNKKIAEVEMRALRAQMNPHFIFNCLNSINRYIVKSDAQTASLYLTKFSKLIRLILDNSEGKNVMLSQELEALKLYIEMEALRFDHKFTYQIELAEGVSVDTIEVPPLIIQPYVENAIWHGLLHKETAGKLLISIHTERDMLVCKIEDNGVGREKAKEFKSKSATSRKSMGMKITEDRISILNEHASEKSSVEIVDLTDANGNAAGTCVIINIQMHHETAHHLADEKAEAKTVF